MHATLDLLGFPFQVIGVSETRENALRGFKMNNSLQGYNLHSQPTRSAAGGVALYTSKSLNAIKRTDLSLTDEEFETVWVEIKNSKSKNILCCCAYRHPSSSPERFTEHIETVLHNLARENKNIFERLRARTSPNFFAKIENGQNSSKLRMPINLYL